MRRTCSTEPLPCPVRACALPARLPAPRGAAGVELPRVGALGALVGYATDPATVGYQPMHVNFGLVPPLEDGKRRSKRDRYQAYADRALEALDAYLATRPDLFGGDRS